MGDSGRISFDDYPVVLKVEHIAQILGISRAGAYKLVKQPGFPAMQISKRICVPRYAFERWVADQINANDQAL